MGDATSNWTPELLNQVKILWKDVAIQQAYTKRDEVFQLNDSAKYFFDDLDRFSPGFSPTLTDILHTRIRTTGIEEAEFEIDGFCFRLVDVGGQRSERRKWIHCFDCVTAILFCVALSEYNQTLREDKSQNRMQESIMMFEEIRNRFEDKPIILFLNKIDLLKEKVEELHIDVSNFFPEFKGPEGKYNDAAEFFKKKFTSLSQPHQQLFPHFTCALNVDHIKYVFDTIRNLFMEGTLDEIGVVM